MNKLSIVTLCIITITLCTAASIDVDMTWSNCHWTTPKHNGVDGGTTIPYGGDYVVACRNVPVNYYQFRFIFYSWTGDYLSVFALDEYNFKLYSPQTANVCIANTACFMNVFSTVSGGYAFYGMFNGTQSSLVHKSVNVGDVFFVVKNTNTNGHNASVYLTFFDGCQYKQCVPSSSPSSSSSIVTARSPGDISQVMTLSTAVGTEGSLENTGNSAARVFTLL